MNIKRIVVGAAAALSLGLAGAPAHAYIFGHIFDDSGADLTLTTAAGDQTIQSDLDATGAPIPGDARTGWYSDTGFHDPGNATYIASRAGDPLLSGTAYNNFFVFDLTTVTDDVISGAIRLWTGAISQDDLFRLGSYSGDIGDLTSGAGGVAAFTALGGGTEYATRNYHTSDYGAWIMIDLDAAFVADINAARDRGDTLFALGGTLEGGPIPPATIPEPASWSLMILGFLGAGAALRARRRELTA
jgi:hypothetical protein